MPIPKPTLTLEAGDRQIAALAAEGVRQGEIAKRLQCHRNTVDRRLRLPTVQALIEAMQAQVFKQASKPQAERLEAMSVQVREERARKREERKYRRALRQGQGTALASESSYDPYWPIRQALAQRQAEAVSLEHEPDPAFIDTQARDWQARLEELKRMMP